MACYDSENARHVDRIRAITFPPDLNPAEHIGAIIKDGVEDYLRKGGDHSQTALRVAIDVVLNGIRGNTELFERLLCSYPARIKAVLQANGGPTDY